MPVSLSAPPTPPPPSPFPRTTVRVPLLSLLTLRHAFPGDAYQTSRGTRDYCGPQELRGKSSVGRRHALGRLSDDACRRDDGLKTTAGGAVSFAPPHTPTPKPSTTSRIGRGVGCKSAYGTLGRETRRGHWSAGAGGLVALRRTDDAGRTMGGTRNWRGAAEYALWTERRQ